MDEEPIQLSAAAERMWQEALALSLRVRAELASALIRAVDAKEESTSREEKPSDVRVREEEDAPASALAEKFVEDASALAVEEQEELIRLLIYSLDEDLPDDPAEVEAAWEAELERRFKAIEDGTAEWISGEESFTKLRAKHFDRELDRRSPSVRDGTAGCLSVDEAMAGIRARLL